MRARVRCLRVARHLYAKFFFGEERGGKRGKRERDKMVGGKIKRVRVCICPPEVGKSSLDVCPWEKKM